MEVAKMRTFLAVVLVVVGMLVGYSLRTIPVSAQQPTGDWFAFNIGGTVRLSVDLPEGVRTCKVTQVSNGFIGCASEDQRQSARWINLRFVKEITPGQR
jgi:hypothetical protein